MESSTTLASFLDFIDRLAVDEKLYWRLADVSEDEHELSWHRDAAPLAWSLKAPGREAIRHNATTLLRALADCGIDRQVAERQLGATILMQAVYADLVVQGAVQLFGEEAVENSREGMRQFLSKVQETAEAVTSEPRLKLITQ